MDTLVEPEHDISEPPWGVWGRDFTLAVVALGGIVLMQWLNALQVEDGDRITRLVTQRTPGTPLFTVCNHTRSRLSLVAGGGLTEPSVCRPVEMLSSVQHTGRSFPSRFAFALVFL